MELLTTCVQKNQGDDQLLNITNLFLDKNQF